MFELQMGLAACSWKPWQEVDRRAVPTISSHPPCATVDVLLNTLCIGIRHAVPSLAGATRHALTRLSSARAAALTRRDSADSHTNESKTRRSSSLPNAVAKAWWLEVAIVIF